LHNAYEARRIAELVETSRRTVKPHQCRCGIDCLRGEDHDECAMTAIVDIEPIDRLGETLALINGLHTYDICPQTGKTAKRGAFILYHRESWNIESQKRKHPVLVQHVCRKGA
jgi:hypothetical protein